MREIANKAMVCHLTDITLLQIFVRMHLLKSTSQSQYWCPAVSHTSLDGDSNSIISIRLRSTGVLHPNSSQKPNKTISLPNLYDTPLERHVSCMPRAPLIQRPAFVPMFSTSLPAPYSLLAELPLPFIYEQLSSVCGRGLEPLASSYSAWWTIYSKNNQQWNPTQYIKATPMIIFIVWISCNILVICPSQRFYLHH